MTVLSQSLSPNMEDYLEAIFQLVQELSVARSKDIARRLKVSRSSVTGALQALKERGLVNYEPYGFITLTDDGAAMGERIARRHEALRDFFVRVLSIDEAEADEAACRMEHGVSKHIVDRLVDFAEFVEICPRAGAVWIQQFNQACKKPQHSEDRCERCMSKCLDDFREAARKGNGNDMETTLDTLKPGEKGLIEKMKGDGAVRRRIRDMGVTKGSLVEVVRIAPLGDPLDVKIKGYHLSLRKEEAADISVKKVGE